MSWMIMFCWTYQQSQGNGLENSYLILTWLEFIALRQKNAIWKVDGYNIRSVYNTYTCQIQNFKTLASLCGCAGRFESYLVANPEDRFSRDEAHIVGANSESSKAAAQMYSLAWALAVQLYEKQSACIPLPTSRPLQIDHERKKWCLI